ncbi:formin-J-like isoform X2 [Chelonus insularis]|uniref:formin-J-like isoform X2 n=1 Tax=Chelonus insularis TaxID=460826 RepID=UPI00158A3ED2|nr:formin-J-like isoform X2 [Chelonus insularis]
MNENYSNKVNAGESRIPVSRAVRPSFLSKSKIVTPSKYNSSVNANVAHPRHSILPGSLSTAESECNLNTPRLWSMNALFASIPSEAGKYSEETFKYPDVWNQKDIDKQHDLSLRKEEKLINKLYGQSMIEDVGSSCLIDLSLSSTSETTGSNSLNTTQFLVLNKQNSFEHDESLGILTPDQMTDFTVALGCSRTPSYENLTGSRFAATTSSSSRASRPTDVPFVVNVDVPGDFCERTPSLEELPLDPKPLDSKSSADHTVNQAAVTITTTAAASSTATSTASLPMSFVTSVTSITSLEAGYQGDGENSRPASRGPDLPLALAANLPVNLPASCRLQDPMTDSDFFTESDADAHEDIGRGDRKAQVIDGTLFCAPVGRRCPSFAGEEMDSSGIYSDLDKRQDELYNHEEPLSEDQTADTADTGDTQVSPKCRVSPTLKPEVPQIIMNYLQVSNQLENSVEASPEKNDVTVIHVSSADSTIRSSNKLLNKVDPVGLKKYKMPKKNVASKIKAMIESNGKEEVKEQRRASRSPRKNGRWDAVMSKIEAGKTEQRSRPPRKEVKSRLLQSLAPTSSSSSSSTSSSSAVTVASAKRLTGDANNNSNANKDKRRTRARQGVTSPTQETARSSVRSSMSDLSSAPSKGTTSSKRSPATGNQQRRVVNGRGSLKLHATNNDPKKACTLDLSPLNLDKSPTPIRKAPSTRRAMTLNTVNNSEKLQNGSTLNTKDRATKDINTSTVISTRITTETQDHGTQTDINDESHQIQLKRANNTIEALCLTVQYSTNELENHNKQAQVQFQELKETHGILEETLEKERQDHEKALDKLRAQLKADHTKHINDLQDEKEKFEIRLKSSLDEIKNKYKQIIERLKSEHEFEIEAKEKLWRSKQAALESQNSQDELDTIKNEYDSLKMCLKPVMKFKNRVILKLRQENDELKQKIDTTKDLQKKINSLEDQLKKEAESKKIISEYLPNEKMDCSLSNDQVATLRAEIWSLRSVLELRSQENASMRSENEILRRDVEGKETLEQRVETLEARCEDLKAQLQGKESYERQLSHQNEILLGSFHEISKQNKRLMQRNEELQWRLRQKSEVVSVLANQLATPTPRLSRSLGPEHIEHSITADKNSTPTSSSMIKFMVHKGDSVSWTLEIDESCDPLPNHDARPAVSRQNSLRRSTRKPIDTRARSKSISTSDVPSSDGDWSPGFNSTPMCSRRRPGSDPSPNALVVPTSPNVSNAEVNTGPRPQEAGGEAMISEEASATSSEDESSAGSDIPRLSLGYDWNHSVE